jgi:single-stranded-DNA-specific exonuclease
MDYLYQLNNERKTEVLAALKTLLSISQPYAPYIYYSDARSGILGLIAQKLETESGLPTLVVTKGTGARSMYHGSGRSPEWYPCLTKLSDKIFVGGHEGSFGCGINSNEELISLYQFLMADVPAVMETVEFVEAKPDFVISTDWTKDIGIDIPTFENYLQEIEFYRPFGKGFPAPVAKLVFHNRDVVTPKDKKSGWEVMGKAKQHLKIHLANGFEVICWNQAYLISQKDSFDEHAVIGNLKFSEFRGVRSVVFDGTLMEQ